MKSPLRHSSHSPHYYTEGDEAAPRGTIISPYSPQKYESYYSISSGNKMPTSDDGEQLSPHVPARYPEGSYPPPPPPHYYHSHHHSHRSWRHSHPQHPQRGGSGGSSSSGGQSSAFQDLTHSNHVNGNSNSGMATPPPESPHGGPPRYDYASYEAPYYQPPVPVSHRGGGPGGYSYYHQHPNSRPPIMSPPHPPPPPPSMEPMYQYSSYYHQPYGYYPPPHHHHPPPEPATSRPMYDSGTPSLRCPSYETPPTPPPPPMTATPPTTTTSYYHDQQYPSFLPPSASITTCASKSSMSTASIVPRDSIDEDYSGGHHYESRLSPQSSSPTTNCAGLTEVNQVGHNDVLCGRGAPTNYHPGNEYFRDLVNEYKGTYLASKRADKPFVASHIVHIIQSRGGRFLRRYKRNGVSWERGHFVWVEVDPQKAYEKACQALREGAPEIRRKMQPTASTDDEEEEDDVDDNGNGNHAEVVVVGGEQQERGAADEQERVASAATTTTTSTGTPGSATIQHQSGERVQQDDQKQPATKEGSAARESPARPSDDDRNDEMLDSERS